MRLLLAASIALLISAQSAEAIAPFTTTFNPIYDVTKGGKLGRRHSPMVSGDPIGTAYNLTTVGSGTWTPNFTGTVSAECIGAGGASGGGGGGYGKKNNINTTASTAISYQIGSASPPGISWFGSSSTVWGIPETAVRAAERLAAVVVGMLPFRADRETQDKRTAAALRDRTAMAEILTGCAAALEMQGMAAQSQAESARTETPVQNGAPMVRGLAVTAMAAWAASMAEAEVIRRTALKASAI